MQTQRRTARLDLTPIATPVTTVPVVVDGRRAMGRIIYSPTGRTTVAAWRWQRWTVGPATPARIAEACNGGRPIQF